MILIRDKLIKCSFVLTFSFFSASAISQADQKSRCDTDGFCTIISVQNEVEQRTPSPAGVVVGTIGDDGFVPAPSGKVQSAKVCRKNVRVPRSVYDAVTRMFDSIVRRGGVQSLPASLTPSEQTVLLYYNTIMQQTMNFQCP
jgi:hypothetical protein